MSLKDRRIGFQVNDGGRQAARAGKHVNQGWIAGDAVARMIAHDDKVVANINRPR